MIGISSFTHRLGNQMWQIAVCDSLAKQNNDVVAYPEWKYAQYFEGDFTPNIQGSPSYVWEEQNFHYTPINYKSNMTIRGYFQSYKYLDEELVKSKFKFKESIINDLKEKHKELLIKPNCSIHIRRGDYLTLPNHHPTVTLDYVMSGVKTFPKETIFLVFSDDTEWCKNSFPAIGKKFFIIEGQSDIEDLALQTLCQNNIISNSSYSWWAAYLNQNADKKVIFPKKWFGSAYAHYDTKDMNPKIWDGK